MYMEQTMLKTIQSNIKRHTLDNTLVYMIELGKVPLLQTMLRIM